MRDIQEREYLDGFLPSHDLAKKYVELYEKRLEKESTEDEPNIKREQFIQGIEIMGEHVKLTEEQMQQVEQNTLGDMLMEEIISYTKHISYIKTKLNPNRKNLQGIVVKLTENNSFNQEFLQRLSDNIYIEDSNMDFYRNVHGEFLNYVKDNTLKLHYARLIVNPDDEIEFHDFKKREPYPTLDKALNDKN